MAATYAVAGVVLGIVSTLFEEGGVLTGSESSDVILHIRVGPSGGRFYGVYEAEGCTDKGWVGKGTFDMCLGPYESLKEKEGISCKKFLHRITLTPYPKRNKRIDILYLEIHLGQKLTGARKLIRFWPEQMCNYCEYCRDVGGGFLEAPFYFEGKVFTTTSEFRSGISSMNEKVFCLHADRHLTFHTGTWSSASALNWKEQEKYCNAQMNLAELTINKQPSSCNFGAAAAAAADEDSEESKNKQVFLASKTLFSKKKTVPITFHERDVFHVGLNKTGDLHVTVDVAPEESCRFLLGHPDHLNAAEDPQLLRRACPTCVSVLRRNFRDIKGRLSRQVNY
ncbi:hypothetical protein CBR_g48734 [Chara braunii]|uniref:Uncharacterized protein n=1 Tax=Chara braunii TaxID=69332 RepID=A0A388K4L3_CHABU|nr:hypothetical protein CBR_g48734 [Chara braunii]|eukprot:GBG64985.1 hypothetical protein CBR_g48734 [Chara braunii]